MRAKYAAFMGIALALAIVLGYVERLIPFNIGIFGVKIGLANIMIILVLRLKGITAALTINILRIVIVNLLFGSTVSLVFSLFGGVTSTLCMYFALKIKALGIVGVSAIGGTMHNLGQSLSAAIFLGAGTLKLMPMLLIFGEASGIICGILAVVFLNNLPKSLFLKNNL